MRPRDDIQLHSPPTSVGSEVDGIPRSAPAADSPDLPTRVARRVTVTGARGALARAIERQLRETGYDVERVRQGDVLLDAVRRSESVVVLDGAVGGNYRIALRAVAHAVEQVGSRPVVAVSVAPRRERGRRSLAAEEGAEAEVRAEGLHLRVIRAGFVVGSPRQMGPEGRGFPVHWGRVWIPGRGSQSVHPIVIDDLAAIVVEAVSNPAAEDVVAEGPELSIEALVETVNGRGVPKVHFRRWMVRLAGPLAILVFYASLLVPYLLRSTDLTTSAGRETSTLEWTPVVASLPVSAVLLLAWIFMILALRALPVSDAPLGVGSGSASVLGVRVRPLDEVWPSASWQARREQLRARRKAEQYSEATGTKIIAAGLILLGLAALMGGAHDFWAVADLGTKLAAALLALAGTVMLVGGVALLRTAFIQRYAVGFLGTLVAAMTTALLGIAAVTNGDEAVEGWLVGITGCLAAIAGSIILWRRGGLLVKDFFVKGGGVKAFSSVVVGGTVVALTQFAYTTFYVPASAVPSLSLGATLKARGETSNMTRLEAQMTFTNTSGNPVTLIRSSYVIEASRLRLTTKPRPLDRFGAVLRSTGRARTSTDEVRVVVVEMGRALSSSLFLDPGEKAQRTVVVNVPKGKHVVRLTVRAVFSRRRFERPPEIRALEEPFYPSEWEETARLEDPSWIHAITRSTRYLHFTEAIGPASSRLENCPDSTAAAAADIDTYAAPGLLSCDGRSGLARHYGLTVDETSTELALINLERR